MAIGGKEAFVIVLVCIGMVALVLLLLINLPLLIWAALALLTVAIFLIAALIVVGFLASIPMYFLKKERKDEKGANYRLEDIKPVKEEDKK